MLLNMAIALKIARLKVPCQDPIKLSRCSPHNPSDAFLKSFIIPMPSNRTARDILEYSDSPYTIPDHIDNIPSRPNSCDYCSNNRTIRTVFPYGTSLPSESGQWG